MDPSPIEDPAFIGETRVFKKTIQAIYPGHGAISHRPEEDMHNAIQNARQLLKNDRGNEILNVIQYNP